MEIVNYLENFLFMVCGAVFRAQVPNLFIDWATKIDYKVLRAKTTY